MTSVSVDQIAGLQSAVSVKGPVRAATTANISLVGLQTIDTVVLAEGDRVLVKAQTDQTKNGIYIASALAWVRAGDFDEGTDVVTGTQVFVTNGAVSAGLCYGITTANPIVLGTSNITYAVSLTGPTGSTGATGPTGPTGPTGASGAGTIEVQTVAAAAVTTIGDTDLVPNVQTTGPVTKKITWLNFKATLWTALGPAIATFTAKATPVDADGVVISDSASAGATSLTTFTQMWANYFKAKADALYQAKTALLTAFVGLANAAGSLTNDGAGNLSWGAGTGGQTLLATLNTTSGTTQIATGLSGSYKDLKIVCRGVQSSGSGQLQMQASADNGGTYSASLGLGGGTQIVTDTCSGTAFLWDYVGSAPAKMGRTEMNSGSSYGDALISYVAPVGIVNAIKFLWAGGLSFTAGTIQIYGVK